MYVAVTRIAGCADFAAAALAGRKVVGPSGVPMEYFCGAIVSVDANATLLP